VVSVSGVPVISVLGVPVVITKFLFILKLQRLAADGNFATVEITKISRLGTPTGTFGTEIKPIPTLIQSRNPSVRNFSRHM